MPSALGGRGTRKSDTDMEKEGKGRLISSINTQSKPLPSIHHWELDEDSGGALREPTVNGRPRPEGEYHVTHKSEVCALTTFFKGVLDCVVEGQGWD